MSEPRIDIRIDGRWVPLPTVVPEKDVGVLPPIGAMPMVTDSESMHLRTTDNAYKYILLRNRWERDANYSKAQGNSHGYR